MEIAIAKSVRVNQYEYSIAIYTYSTLYYKENNPNVMQLDMSNTSDLNMFIIINNHQWPHIVLSISRFSTFPSLIFVYQSILTIVDGK